MSLADPDSEDDFIPHTANLVMLEETCLIYQWMTVMVIMTWGMIGEISEQVVLTHHHHNIFLSSKYVQ